MASSKYRYDINLGHYIPLLEGEAPQTGETQNQDQNSQETQQNQEQQTQQQKAQPINLDSDDVVKMRQERENVLKNLQDTIDKKNNNLIQCQQQVADAQNSSDTDQTSLNALQKTMIQAMKEVSDAQFELAKKKNEYDNKIFQLQAKLVEGIQLAFNNLPEKYRNLNESNVQNAKVYISKIFENDYQQRIKGMVDFKKAFANSNLLYGKDKEGYFVVCVDQEDLNKLTNTLIEIGYDKDEIYGVVLSQMFDRSDLVKA